MDVRRIKKYKYKVKIKYEMSFCNINRIGILLDINIPNHDVVIDKRYDRRHYKTYKYDKDYVGIHYYQETVTQIFPYDDEIAYIIFNTKSDMLKWKLQNG